MEMDVRMNDVLFDDILRSESFEGMVAWIKDRKRTSETFFTVFCGESEAPENERDKISYENESRLYTRYEDYIGNTPLHIALDMRRNSPDLFLNIVSLINSSAGRDGTLPINFFEERQNWEVLNSSGYSLLALAVKNNDVKAIELLLSAGCNIVSQCCVSLKEGKEDMEIKTTILGLSIVFNSMEAFKTLISLGADVNQWDMSGRRAVHLAARFGKLDALQTLLEIDCLSQPMSRAKAKELYLLREDFSVRNDSENEDDNIETEDSLRRGEASQISRNESEEEQEDFPESTIPLWPHTVSADYEADGEFENASNDDDSSDLFGPEDILRIEREMQEAGFEVRRDDAGNITARFRESNEEEFLLDEKEYGGNLLHIAVQYRQSDVVFFLLKAAKSAQNIDDKRGDGMSAAHIAARNNDVKILHLLSEEAGADINTKNDVFGMSPIHIASENGAQDAIEFLLSQGVSPNSRDDNGFTPLHYAAAKDLSNSCVEKLLSYGANVNAVSVDGETPVYTSISRWNVDAFWSFMKNGGDPSIAHSDGTVVLGFIAANSMAELARFSNYVADRPNIKEAMDFNVPVGDEGQTALHIAIREGSAEAVEALLRAGSSASTVDENSIDAMQLALQQTEIKKSSLARILSALIEAGSNVNEAGSNRDLPLHFACKMGLHSVIQTAIDFGANKDAKVASNTALHICAWRKDEKALKILLSEGANSEAHDENGLTPLLICCTNHFVRGVQTLVSFGANIEALSLQGNGCLHLCAEIRSHEVSNVIEYLTKSGISLNTLNKAGDPPLQVHIRERRTDAVRALLSAGCSTDMLSRGDQTALMTACDIGHIESIRILLQYGANVNMQNSTGHTAIFFFAESEVDTIRSLRLLIHNGADLAKKDKDGDTVLHEAALGDNPKIAKFLIHKKLNINARNNQLETPLFQASERGFIEVVNVLTSSFPSGQGADPKIPDRGGISPYHAAQQQGHANVMRALLQAMKITLSTFAPIVKYSRSLSKNGESSSCEKKSPEQAAGRGSEAGKRDSENMICIVCQDEFQESQNIRNLPCGHVFHDQCILPWIGGELMSNNKACPVCKQPVAPKDF